MYFDDDRQQAPAPPEPPIFFSQYLGSAAQIGLAGSISLTLAVFGRIVPGFAWTYGMLLTGASLFFLCKAASEYKPQNRVIWLLPLGAIFMGAAFGLWDALRGYVLVQGLWVGILAATGSLALIVTLASLATAKPPTPRKTRQAEASFYQVEEEINPWS